MDGYKNLRSATPLALQPVAIPLPGRLNVTVRWLPRVVRAVPPAGHERNVPALCFRGLGVIGKAEGRIHVLVHLASAKCLMILFSDRIEALEIATEVAGMGDWEAAEPAPGDSAQAREAHERLVANFTRWVSRLPAESVVIQAAAPERDACES